MKKYFLYAFLFFTSFERINAQITFEKKYSNGTISGKQPVIQTLDGGYAYSSYWNSKLYINRVSEQGNLEWSKIFPLVGEQLPTSLIQIPNGHYLGGGIFFDTTQLFASDYFLFETDSSGNMIWAKAYGDSNLIEQAFSMQMTNDNGYILAGGMSGSSLLVKTNSNGDTLWTKIYSDSVQGLGCHFIQQTFDNGYILCGREGYDCYLLKTDSTGEVLWIKSFSNDYSGTYGNFPYEIHQTLDSGYIIGGFRDTVQGGDAEAFLIRTDKYGDTLWTRVFNSPGRDFLYSVVQSSDGGITFTGTTYLNQNQLCYIAKTDLSGDTLWMKSNSLLDWSESYSIIYTSDEGYLLTGICSEPGLAEMAAFLIKTDSSGSGGCYQQHTTFDISTLQTTISNPTIYSQPASITVKSIAVQTVDFNIIDSTFCSSVSISETEPDIFTSIFPNPATSTFTITTHLQNAQIEIYNLIGEKLYVVPKLRDEPLTVNCELFPEGIYIVKLQSEKVSAVQKLIVQ